jgi:hypothetical protein
MEEEQQMEIEALQAIYDNDFSELPESGGYVKHLSVRLVPFPGEEDRNKVGLTLDVQYASKYPSEVPQLDLVDLDNVNNEQYNMLLEKIRAQVWIFWVIFQRLSKIWACQWSSL